MSQSKVTIKGTGQLNGPKVINKTVEMDTSMAKEFTGGNRYQVIEAFVSKHYPGVQINPKNIGVNVVPIKSASEKNTKKETTSTSKNTKDSEKSSSTKNIAKGAALAVGGILLSDDNNEEKNEFDLKQEKEKIELEYFKKQKEIEHQNQLLAKKQKLKAEKLNVLKTNFENGGNKFEYYFLRTWTHCDNWWKKGLFIYFTLFIISIFIQGIISIIK